MSVKFILSNTFGFSADNMYRLIAKNIGNGRQIVIVPDKFSLAFERNILKKLGLTSTFDVDVTSFMRLAVKAMRGKNRKCLTPEGSVMLLKRAIDEVKNDLTVYKDVDDVTFPREMYAVITALRNSGVNAENTLAVDDEKLKDVVLFTKNILKYCTNRLLIRPRGSKRFLRVSATTFRMPTYIFSDFPISPQLSMR